MVIAGAAFLALYPQAHIFVAGKEAFAAGHVTGARHMPSDQIVKAGETLKKHKDKPIVVYCESGPLAASAVRQLIAQGFTKVCSLRGGLSAWRSDNLPIAKS